MSTLQIVNKAEEDTSMSKHALQMKVCYYFPQDINKIRGNEKFWKFDLKTENSRMCSDLKAV